MNMKVGIAVFVVFVFSFSLIENALAQTRVPTSSPSPTMTASLSESASALNYGNKINFTVTVDGGVPPYTFAWYVDDQLAETSSSQYYSTNTLQVGSHHVNVQVNDAKGNTATTLGVAFEVLISLSPSSSTSTQQPTTSPSPNPTEKQQAGFLGTGLPTEMFFSILAVILIVAIVGAAIVTRRRKK